MIEKIELHIDKTISIVSSYINSFPDSLKNIEVKLSEMNIQSKVLDQYAANFSDTLTNWLTNFANNLASSTVNISGYIYNSLFGPIAALARTIIFGVLNAQYSQVLIAIIVLIVIQQIDVNIIAPKLLGKSVSLKPVFILISLLIGADVGGILGMVLAVPVAALIKLFLIRSVELRLKKKEVAVFKAEPPH